MERNFGVLIEKSKKTLKNEGVKGFIVKAKNWTIFRLKHRKREEVMKDILFINGCGLPHPERYRVDHQIEQLEANGLAVDKIFYTEVNPKILKYYRGVIIFRCPITESINELIDKANYFNKKIFFDVDDLVIDRKYTDKIKYVQEMSEEERETYNKGVKLMGETMQKCDYLITSTPALARELRKYNKEVFVNKNVASEEMVRLSLKATQEVRKNSEKIAIGYLSGSITHNPDFELIKPALVKIMDEFPETELTVMGYLDLPDELKRFSKRVVRRPFGSWQKLPEIIASLDINLAPIEETIFNEAKSENKWTEASLCKVVTVASDYGAFKTVITDGVDGMLCRTSEDWYKKIKKLIKDEELRKRIAGNAHKKVMKEYITTYSGLPLTKFIESKLAKNIAFVLPSTNVSGGVNVVLKHCEILRNNGWDAMVINMDVSDKNVVSSFGETNVISGVKHPILARFDRMVATLYTTLSYIEAYPKVRKKIYLVQGFETNFGEYGSAIKRVANATYNALDNVSYVTVSKWCKKWLKEDYKKEAKYAPNGINLDNFDYRERKIGSQKIKILVEGNTNAIFLASLDSINLVNGSPE